MATIVITGAARGIGLEFCRQYVERGDTVYGACRTSSKALNGLGAQVVEGVDVTLDAGRACLAEAMSGVSIDVLVNNAGILESDPERGLDADSIRRQFEVNALGPLLVTEVLRPFFADVARVAMITSRMGSVSDNTSGGAYGYRMSKAALNAAAKSLAMDLSQYGISVGILHPGYVRTEMTKQHGFIDADESVRGLIARIDGLNLKNSGTFWHQNGEVLPW